MVTLYEHFNRMTGMAAAYITPEPYVSIGGDTSTWDDGLERPDLRAHLFANDLLMMLDGPEQREACAAAQAPFQAIRQWAADRNLIEGATSQAQTVKLFEEGGEVAHAVARNDRDALKDGIGDMIVVLTILAAQNGLTVEECVGAAYDEIKDRKGVMRDGVFIRD